MTKNAIQTRAFPILQAAGLSQWDLSPLQAPKPLGLEFSAFFWGGEGSPWGRLSGETKMASLWAKLTPYCGL